MPALPPDSTDSPPPSATPSSELAGPSPPPRTATAPLAWRANAWLFAVTVGSVFFTGYCSASDLYGGPLRQASQFTCALLGILLAHEFGHFIAARLHKVDASLPYFIPLPYPLSPFGTMGAVIRMRSVIPTRRALLDIGAAGPLAGLALALPLYAWGVARSRVVPLAFLGDGGGMELGNSLILRALDHAFGPAVQDGMDIVLSPVAFAAWTGMFVTMINLLPVGQLDGGHVAFSLFGPRQNRIAQWVHRSMLAFFFVSLASFVERDVRTGLGLWHIGHHVCNSLAWLVWFEVLSVLGLLSSPPTRGRADNDDRLGIRTRVFGALGLAIIAGMLRDETSTLAWGAWFMGLAVLLLMEVRGGSLRPSSRLLDHPATGREPLRWGRAAIAIVTLAFFVLLFMPTPIAL
ncbi:MAG: site-2 protease family protein [Polyangiaceae bacterium]|jgi:membrane-associated protease RseP (regulator of RpoE activity)